MAEPLELVRSRSVENSRQVPGYQDVRFTPDAFGAGIGRALQQLGATGSELAAAVKQSNENTKGNQALDLARQAKDELRRATYDPQNGMLARKGNGSIGVGQQSYIVTDDIKRKYLEANKDPEVQAAFSKIWDREAETNRDMMARYELTERENYAGQVTQGMLMTAVANAYDGYTDQTQIDKSIEDVRTAIRINRAGASRGRR